ncbi:hypothetical protein NUW58_g3086 [Xylaria curta]|uniref:Uncharacterized protein n=1 Tax=Xylaria curta TaxID=42375 RepID=A0ACC1PCN2_9PEZI|nr:hypothetical protein NUW58_g3086 [Xylaria curta]
MAFETTAFDLSSEEKHAILGEIKSSIFRIGALLARENKVLSVHDLEEALQRADEAFIWATDSDACDPSLAPLATIFLYRGHILLGLGQQEEAYKEYKKSATSKINALTDVPSARDAARRLVELRNQGENGPATAQEAFHYFMSCDFTGTLRSTARHEGGKGRVTVKPGPGKKPGVVNPE